MKESNFELKEDVCIRVNKIFEKMSVEEKNSLSRINSILNEDGNCEAEPNLKKFLFLLAKICSPILNLESRNDPFQPVITWGKERSFLPIDLNDEEMLCLSGIIDEDLPPILKARIADILWDIFKTKKQKILGDCH